MKFNNYSISNTRQSNIITPQGADLTLGVGFSPHVENGTEMAIIAHLKNKYDILSKKYGFSPDDRELLDSLNFVSSDEDLTNGCDPIIGRTFGIIYPKPNISLRLPHSKEIFDELEELKRDNPEYFLSLIKVGQEYIGLGVGSTMLKFAEYNAALEFNKQRKKQGFIEGHFFPLDESKSLETEQFYRKNGFELYENELFKPINVEKVLDEVSSIFERE